MKGFWEYPYLAFQEEQIVYIQFSEAWKRTAVEKDFANYIGETVMHETMHYVIGVVTEAFEDDWTDLAEEIVVRSLLLEEFTKEDRKWYK